MESNKRSTVIEAVRKRAASNAEDNEAHRPFMEKHSQDHIRDGKRPTQKAHFVAENVILLAASALIMIIIIVALAVWLGLNKDFNRESWSSLHGRPIGGHLTQPQAKAIDVLCSAFLGPVIVSSFCFVWFAIARAAVVTEKSSAKGHSLLLMTRLAQSEAGSYSPLKLWPLLVSKSIRFNLLALLTILAAVTNSAFSNVIAYESFQHSKLENSSSLRQLNDAVITASSSLSAMNPDLLGVYGFDTQQTSSFANQLTGMLTGISFQNATPNLDDGFYTMINATTESLKSLPTTITELYDVPGSRWSVQCEPGPSSITLGIIQLGEIEVDFNIIGHGYLMQGYYPGNIASLQTAYNEVYPLLLFSFDGSFAYIGFLYSFNGTNTTVTTDYGDLHPIAQNMTYLGFDGTKTVMSFWGIVCSLWQQEGTLDLVRTPNGTSWITRSSTWSATKRQAYNMLSVFQDNLNYNAPGSTIPGVGSALSQSSAFCSYKSLTIEDEDTEGANCTGDPYTSYNFTTYAQNLLYTAGETARIAYEVAATNSSRDLPEYFYTVPAMVSVQHYRITYVPVILIIGFVATFIASLVTALISFLAWRSVGFKHMHQIDVCRLLVDFAVGLDADEREELAHRQAVVQKSNSDLANWASQFKVRYEKASLDDGFEDGDEVLERTRIKLRHVKGSRDGT